MLSCKENKNLPDKYKAVASVIRVGKENATLLSDIVRLTDLKERRQAYTIIENLINDHGFVIGASRKGEHRGYYYPGNNKEFEEVATVFKKTIDSMEKRYMNLLENYKKMGA